MKKYITFISLISNMLIHGMDYRDNLLDLPRPKESQELRDSLKDMGGELDSNDSKNVKATHQKTFDLKSTLNKEEKWPRYNMALSENRATSEKINNHQSKVLAFKAGKALRKQQEKK